MTVTLDQIAAAEATARLAASQSYAAYQTAKLALEALQAAYVAQQPARAIVVAGNTYPHRKALAALGLRWDTTARAWTGTVRGAIDLPRGCYETTYGSAAVASMDYANSDC